MESGGKANMPTGSLVIDVPVENDVGNPMPEAYHLRMAKKPPIKMVMTWG